MRRETVALQVFPSLSHLLDRLLVVLRDELAHEVAAHHALGGEARHLRGLLVPHVDAAANVDPEDGRVRLVDEPRILALEERCSQSCAVRYVSSRRAARNERR